MALFQGQFSTNGNVSLYTKITLLLILIVFGFINGYQIMKGNLNKHRSMLVHIGIFLVSAAMLYLVQVEPF